MVGADPQRQPSRRGRLLRTATGTRRDTVDVRVIVPLRSNRVTDETAVQRGRWYWLSSSVSDEHDRHYNQLQYQPPT